MDRAQIFDLMSELKLYGMNAAFDEIMATAVKRQHEHAASRQKNGRAAKFARPVFVRPRHVVWVPCRGISHFAFPREEQTILHAAASPFWP